MSIASEITRLQGVKADILQAIADKGVTVPAGSALDDCPALIASIPSSGGVIVPFEFFQGSRGIPGDEPNWPNHITIDSDRICSQVITAPVGAVVMMKSSLYMGIVDGNIGINAHQDYAWYKEFSFIVKRGTITISFKNNTDTSITPADGDGYYMILELPPIPT